ncbi:MAG: hypothetical protein ABR525_10005 [Candidatus Limnocylindria bacterium]
MIDAPDGRALRTLLPIEKIGAGKIERTVRDIGVGSGDPRGSMKRRRRVERGIRGGDLDYLKRMLDASAGP